MIRHEKTTNIFFFPFAKIRWPESSNRSNKNQNNLGGYSKYRSDTSLSFQFINNLLQFHSSIPFQVSWIRVLCNMINKSCYLSIFQVNYQSHLSRYVTTIFDIIHFRYKIESTSSYFQYIVEKFSQFQEQLEDGQVMTFHRSLECMTKSALGWLPINKT